MKIDVGKIALVVVLIAGVQTTTLYHRINDLECQRDIYKSRYGTGRACRKKLRGMQIPCGIRLKRGIDWTESCW